MLGGFLLALHLNINPGSAQGTVWDAGGRIQVGHCKATVLLTVMSLCPSSGREFLLERRNAYPGGYQLESCLSADFSGVSTRGRFALLRYVVSLLSHMQDKLLPPV